MREAGGAVVDPILLERLGLKVGDPIAIGKAEVIVRDDAAEPDHIVDRLGIRAARDGLAGDAGEDGAGAAGHARALALRARPRRGGVDREGLAAFRGVIATHLPEAGFTVADRRDPPQVSRTLERLRQFLT